MEQLKTLDDFRTRQRDELDEFFDEFLEAQPIFKDKSVLQSNFIPQSIPHREHYLRSIAKILAPALRCERPSNVFMYGETGTGKTLCVNHVLKKMDTIAQKKNVSLKIISINCKLKRVADTEYRVLLELLQNLGIHKKDTGHSTNELYNELYKSLDEKKQTILLVLDEIDTLIKKAGDDILYNFTRINEKLKLSEISLIGITNDLIIMDEVDSRVKSSLNEEEINFTPYNAVELQSILQERENKAFRPGVLHNEVIPKCSAYAGREHGDARRALELLKLAGELAERENSGKVMPKHIDTADKKREKNRVIEIIKSQPKQAQIVIYSIIKTSQKEKLNLITNKKTTFIEPTTTGFVYDYYNKIAKLLRQPTLTLRRISDIIVELDTLGLINFKIVSKGRYGRTRIITLGLPKSLFTETMGILKKSLMIEN